MTDYRVHYFVMTKRLQQREPEIVQKCEMNIRAKNPRAAMDKINNLSTWGFFNRAFKAEVIK